MMITNNEIAPYILTPTQRICRAEQVKYTEGAVTTEEWKKRGFTLKYQNGGKKPYLIVDFGRASVGGYPVFRVKSHHQQPVLRISYSDWYPYLLDTAHRDKGDFSRGCCKYLGVELPALPGNPNRYELYTISRTGTYLYPLIQGQQRFALLTLDTPGEVEIEDFYIYYTADMAEHDGHFQCSRPDLNQLWYSSTYTVQISSIDNSQSWETVENTFLLRALTKGNPAGIYRKGCDWRNYTFRFVGQIAVNPDCSSGIGWLVRAKDENNGYLFRLSLDGMFRWYIRKNAVAVQVGEKKLDLEILDNMPYTISTTAQDDKITISLDGSPVLTWKDHTFSKGSVGFCQTTESWAMVNNLEVVTEHGVLLQDDFKQPLGSDYAFTRALPFLADGAKRDRLPWIGDLDWAGRNVYYAFSDMKYMWGSLEIFARHQTPEGYIWGACYPENQERPHSGEYGYYESDIFSAWFVPTLWDYLLFTGNHDQVSELYEPMRRDLDYLWSMVEGNGLFFQRYATSKGLWDHELNDIGYFSYNNIIVYDALQKGAWIARELSDYAAEKLYAERAAMLKSGIMRHLWNEEQGCFPKGLHNGAFCHMANCLALAVGILSQEQAKRAIDQLLNWFPKNLVYGKIVSLFIRGCFRYGFDDIAFQTLVGKTGLSYEGGTPVHVNWLDSIADENGPATTTECMLYPPAPTTDGEKWGDRSHPDTAVAHLLTGYLLGVEPTACGYQTCQIQPHCCGLAYAKGIIPTRNGAIQVEWQMQDDLFKLSVNHPKEITLEISTKYIPCQKKEITVNGELLNTL